MQMDYQLRLQGSSNGFQPCLALLCCESRAGGACASPARLLRVSCVTEPPRPTCFLSSAAPYYSGNPGPESKISPFWVMPPPEVGGAAGGGQGRCVRAVDRRLVHWGRARGAHWPLLSWDGGLRVASGDQLVFLPAKAE